MKKEEPTKFQKSQEKEIKLLKKRLAICHEDRKQTEKIMEQTRKMLEAVIEEESIKQLRMFRKFVPKQFMDLLNKEHIEQIKLGDAVKQEISVLFNDIRSFTTLIEELTPEDAFAFINRYWKFMAPIIRNHNGYIDGYQGDAILAIFPGHPSDALEGANAMMRALEVFNEKEKEIGAEQIDMGIGISTGSAMLGVIGEDMRQVSGLISDVANTAARIEGLNKMYNSHILLSGETVKGLGDSTDQALRQVDKVRLKGKHKITSIYEVIYWKDRLQKIALKAYLEKFGHALDLYETGDFKNALIAFQKCETYLPEDVVTENLIQRCQQFLREGSPEDWDGTIDITHK